MGGPVYFPLGTPKLDLSKVQIGEKTGEKIGRTENHYFVPCLLLQPLILTVYEKLVQFRKIRTQ